MRRVVFCPLLAVLPLLAATPDGFTALAGPVPFPARTPTRGSVTADVRHWRESVARRPSGFGWRKLAEACERALLFQEAADAYRREAAVYRHDGDVNGALVEEAKANWLDTRVSLYDEEILVNARCGPAKFEPAVGCYVGAIIERDPKVRGDYEAFNALTGKHHSLFYDYREYGKPFPSDWAQRVKAAGAGIQIALEPNSGLSRVQDDAELQGFARAAAAADMPVFLRYASEMNGDWTPYSHDPADYIAKWRLVHDVMARHAPNVAMVWCPNALPAWNIARYYPGDDYVDWVGVNFYSVRFHDGNPQHPADKEDPADLLEAVYRPYAARKPIMVCEYAATHHCSILGRSIPDFAVGKLQRLFAALPRRFPRVKAICWYDINNLSNAGARSERRTNDFTLTTDPTVLAGYQQAVNSPYFLTSVQPGPVQERGVRYLAVKDGRTLRGRVHLSAGVSTYHDRPTVAAVLDGREQVATNARPFELEWDTTKVRNGPHNLELRIIVDSYIARKVTWKVKVSN
ncbi:MAG: hypothetical protein HYU66_09825 [Armatimonadetes bacterium]|nr:hypothetical protein [Armatimonadota bacterium]